MTGSVCQSLGLFLAASCLPALAGAEGLDDALRRCARESDPAQRLACFDAIVNSLPQVEADRFGMTADIERKRDPVALQQAKDEVLSAKISGLRQAPEGEWIFTLDNRQVWVEAEANPKVQFVVGEDVHIEHGAMSSLWLVADNHRKVRVKRLR
ncbi:MAG TPA: hypothetical protein VK437_01605 [Steroidobacteraceae bacterium]|nr:hypothetical protein [Steroidobacteraceae bacterium]